jgi:hypothetical protein
MRSGFQVFALGLVLSAIFILPALSQIPNIVSVSPGPNALNTARDGDISVTFDVDMDEATINAATFVVGSRLCGLKSGSVSYDGPTKTVITTGVESSSGNSLATGYAWTFTVVADEGTGAYVLDSTYLIGEDKDPWGIDAADYDGDGDFDIAVTSSLDSIFIFSNNGNGVFALPVAIQVGNGPYSITSADFNNDGNLDLAVPCYYDFNSPDSINVLFGYGDGSFELQAVYAVGRSARIAFAADYNGDGFIDLATANHDSENLSVLLNNGNGTFAGQVTYAAGEYPDAIFGADLDGDGDFDLIHTNQYTGKLRTYFNDGSGNFTFGMVYDAGVSPRSSHVADVDSDGDNDIIIGNRADYSNGAVSVFLNDGDGTFPTRTEYPNDGRPSSVKTADFDADGDLDIAAANSNDFSVTILEGNGDGTFGATYSYGVSDYPQIAFPADFDGDGDIDLATPNWGTNDIAILLNKFNLTLEPGEADFSAISGGANPPDQFITIESNGDQLDILTSDDADWLTISTDYSTTPTIMTLSPEINGLIPDNYSGEITVISNEAENAPIYVDVNLMVKQAHNIISTLPHLNDLDADVETDISVKFDKAMSAMSINESSFLIRSQSLGLRSGSYIYNSSDSTVTFYPAESFKAGEQITVTLTTGLQAYDGTPLDSSFGWSFATSTDTSSGYFSPQAEYSLGNGPGAVFAADIDNDGDFDLLTANYNSDDVGVFINNGDGTFAPDTVYAAGNSPFSIYAGDFDSDGYIDMAVANVQSANISVFKNNGDLTFQDQVTYDVGNAPQSIYGADLDGDGDIDLATANTDSDNLSVLLNNGDGSFASQANYAVTSAPAGVVAADFDSDGDVDLAATNSSSDHVSLFLNYGDGTFTAAEDHLTGNGPYAICAVDVDADGDLDIATTGPGNISVILNNGNATFAGPIIYSNNDFPQAIFAGDIDGDSDFDIVTANFYSLSISVYRNSGAGLEDRFTFDTTYTLGAAPHSIFGADLNDDGRLDLAVGNQFNPSISVLLNETPDFVCADINNDGDINIFDVTSLISFLYLDGPAPESMESADVSGDGDVNIFDVTYIISYLYLDGPGPNCQ